MAAGRARRAAGFTLPLTMALAFSLMTLASAIVGMVVVSDRQAKAAASELVTRTTLESAIEQGLYGLERDGVPAAGEWTDRASLNGLDVTLTFAPTGYKPDINKSAVAELTAVLADPGLSQRVAAALATPATQGAERPQFRRFGDFIQALGADAAAEDCLRRRLTIGRAAGATHPTPPVNALVPPREPLVAPALFDVRAETRDPEGRRVVLWRRVRYTGKPERPWLTHDWREMRLPRSDMDCPAPQPSSSFGPATPQP
jgi:hypothetical protein